MPTAMDAGEVTGQTQNGVDFTGLAIAYRVKGKGYTVPLDPAQRYAHAHPPLHLPLLLSPSATLACTAVRAECCCRRGSPYSFVLA